MKKLLAVMLAAMLALSLAGCFAGNDAFEPTFIEHETDEELQTSSILIPGSESLVEREQMTIATLKGPTTMGLVRLWDLAEEDTTQFDYWIDMKGTADEIVPKLISGQVQAAAVPGNLASVLYNSSQGKIKVAAINTLGVLYVVETGSTIKTVDDLKGKTIYSTGKGTTPEFVMNYILEKNGLDPEKDLTIEYKSEATEIAAILKDADDAIAVLPQPYVTAVQMSNDKVNIALDLTKEWKKVSPDDALVTGVLVVNTEWLEGNTDMFDRFLSDYLASVRWTLDYPAEAAVLLERFGVVEKAEVAEKALSYCNLTYIVGEEMQDWMNGYLQVLYDQNPDAVGGVMPDDNFYYTSSGTGAAPSSSGSDTSASGSGSAA